MSKAYHVGIYCRLSVDDASNSAKAQNYIPSDESVSIENQREMLSKFVMLNGWIETRTYIDDGFSGGNFQRPGFQAMLEDARNGVINLILVRDLSRLGRDFVDVSRYTTEVFPELGVRFVSVLDCLDTSGDTDMLYFRSLMNDYHLRDLSKKIKSVIYSKKASGQYLSSAAPYGYRKSNDDKHKLVIDEYSAGVVRRIYDLRLSGYSYSKIAAVLNQDSILSPRAYWYQNNGKGDTPAISWKIPTVKAILRNPVYCGTLVSNYTGTRSYKDKTTIRKPKSEHLCFEENHEPIILIEKWEKVQKLNEECRLAYQSNKTTGENLLAGKLVCADCRSAMYSITNYRHTKNGDIRRYLSYRCSCFVQTGGACCSIHSISERMLVQIICGDIQTKAKALTLDEDSIREGLKRRVQSQTHAQTVDSRQELSKLRQRVEELETKTARLYEDKVSGSISAEVFTVLMEKYEQERLDKVKCLEALAAEIDAAEKNLAAMDNWAGRIRKYMDIQTLDREIIEELIDRIEVGERQVVDGQRRQNVKIFYRYVGSLD